MHIAMHVDLRVVLCYAENARTAWHRQERQQQWHKQNHQQPYHAATKQPGVPHIKLLTFTFALHLQCSFCTVWVMRWAAMFLCAMRNASDRLDGVEATASIASFEKRTRTSSCSCSVHKLRSASPHASCMTSMPTSPRQISTVNVDSCAAAHHCGHCQTCQGELTSQFEHTTTLEPVCTLHLKHVICGGRCGAAISQPLVYAPGCNATCQLILCTNAPSTFILLPSFWKAHAWYRTCVQPTHDFLAH